MLVGNSDLICNHTLLIRTSYDTYPVILHIPASSHLVSSLAPICIFFSPTAGKHRESDFCKDNQNPSENIYAVA